MKSQSRNVGIKEKTGKKEKGVIDLLTLSLIT